MICQRQGCPGPTEEAVIEDTHCQSRRREHTYRKSWQFYDIALRDITEYLVTFNSSISLINKLNFLGTSVLCVKFYLK